MYSVKYPKTATTNTTNNVANNTANTPTNTPPKANLYTDAMYGYTLELPKNWGIAEASRVAGPPCEGETINEIFFVSPDGSMTVTFGARLKGDDVVISCRTGVGAGVFKEGDRIDVGGTKFPSTNLTDAFGGAALEVFVGHAPTAAEELDADPFVLDGYELVATITQTDPVNDPNAFEPSYNDITQQPAYDEALELLASLKLSE